MHLVVEVWFASGKRKSLPLKSYRPDIVVKDISESYWGITFTKLDVDAFDIPVRAEIKFTFQEKHYFEIKMGQTFHIMEGPNQVGQGTFLSLTDDKISTGQGGASSGI